MLMLFSLYCDMCDVFIEAQGGLQAIDVLASLLLVFLLQFVLLVMSKIICNADNNSNLLIPMIFCGTHKSVTLGFPIMQTMFGGLSHHMFFSLLYYFTMQRKCLWPCY
ncbi:sodium/bile acid cotransporter 7-B-like [Ctenocephalides felis]|uniref:sodium/bile acid cotransporter 7-B-like n=1 Tax=Ctenocephalides felis TaxID=7515 RepID=UPI000E6E218F|nr:sodium/bile acid cotransporter 7-B-like [Ctenocephalides felis]